MNSSNGSHPRDISSGGLKTAYTTSVLRPTARDSPKAVLAYKMSTSTLQVARHKSVVRIADRLRCAEPRREQDRLNANAGVVPWSYSDKNLRSFPCIALTPNSPG